jgi:hypothetical protein
VTVSISHASSTHHASQRTTQIISQIAPVPSHLRIISTFHRAQRLVSVPVQLVQVRLHRSAAAHHAIHRIRHRIIHTLFSRKSLVVRQLARHLRLVRQTIIPFRLSAHPCQFRLRHQSVHRIKITVTIIIRITHRPFIPQFSPLILNRPTALASAHRTARRRQQPRQYTRQYHIILLLVNQIYHFQPHPLHHLHRRTSPHITSSTHHPNFTYSIPPHQPQSPASPHITAHHRTNHTTNLKPRTNRNPTLHPPLPKKTQHVRH